MFSWVFKLVALATILTIVAGVTVNYLGQFTAGKGAPATKVREAAAVENDAGGDDGWTTTIPVSANGHFYVDTIIKSTRVRFMVDTGASRVSLSMEDARRVGIRLRDSDFNAVSRTANGLSRAATFNLDSIRLGDNWVYDVPASVTEGNHHMSLLGMSFLSRLRKFEISNRHLVLYW